MKPDLKKIMEVKSFCSGENIEIGAIIAEIVDYCSKMFSNDLYLNFSLSFAKDIFQKYQ